THAFRRRQNWPRHFTQLHQRHGGLSAIGAGDIYPRQQSHAYVWAQGQPLGEEPVWSSRPPSAAGRSQFPSEGAQDLIFSPCRVLLSVLASCQLRLVSE